MQNGFRKEGLLELSQINEYGGRSVIALSGNVSRCLWVANQTGDASLVAFIDVAEVEQRTKYLFSGRESKDPRTWSESIARTAFGPCTIGHPSRFGKVGDLTRKALFTFLTPVRGDVRAG